jgi:hypothetical protein
LDVGFTELGLIDCGTAPSVDSMRLCLAERIGELIHERKGERDKLWVISADPAMGFLVQIIRNRGMDVELIASEHERLVFY